MGKVENNKKQKHDSLLDTAFALFTSKGVSKTSISDIVNRAGVAKGTFYLYFKDKFDIRNKLISHKSSQLFLKAAEQLDSSNLTNITFEDEVIFIIDKIIDQLNENKSLLNFISKNLSWGIFKTALTSPSSDKDINFEDVYFQLLEESPVKFNQPELMLYMIIELVSSTCYSSILYNEPVTISELKPRLYSVVRCIINEHIIKE